MPADAAASSQGVPDLQQRIKLLEAELRTCTSERDEMARQQAATAEVLRIINESPANLDPVFDAMLQSATRLCDAAFGILWLCDGDYFHAAALHGVPERYAEIARVPVQPSAHNPLGRMLRGERIIVSADAADDELYRTGDSVRQALVDVGGARSFIQVALVKDSLLGSLTVYRTEPRAFSQEQISLLESFGAQAVIAMDNARLLNDQREALEQQTATSEILQVINASPGDLAPVFEAMLENAMRLCGAAFGILRLWDGNRFHGAASRGVPPAYAEFLAKTPQRVQTGSIGARIVAGERLVHVLDVAEDKALLSEDHHRRALVELGGARTSLVVALTKDGKVLGAIQLYRRHVKRFSEKQIGLLQNFGEQVVVAMENARLVGELRRRTDDLAESLEYQTATSEVLEVIGRSTSDVQPVLDAMLSAALRLCRTESGGIAVQQGNGFRYIAVLGWNPAADRVFRGMEITPGRGTVAGRALAEGRVVQVQDVASDPEFERPDMARLSQWHTALGVPLIREGRPIGAIAITRDRIEPFTDRQIALVRTFADQAVIAIENARLLGDLRQRTDDLAQSLEYQTATSNVLKVISQSAFDLQPVLDTMVETAARLCAAESAHIVIRSGTVYHARATFGYDVDFASFVQQMSFLPSRGTTVGRVLLSKQTVHIEDAATDPEYRSFESLRRGARTQLGVPLLREGELVGVIVLVRLRVEPFTEQQIGLASTFADQAVIAMENARLLGELRESLDQQTATGDVLRTISRSSTDLGSVLETLVETVARLCRGDQAYLFRRDGNLHHLLASAGATDEVRDYLRAHPFEPSRGNTSGRAVLERRTIHIPDVLADPEYRYDGISVLGFRTALGIPLLREDTVVGVFVVSRMQVAPFSDKEIELASGFADQALIAIENARLFEELRDRQAELRVTLDNTGDGVVMFDADFRLASWNRNFQEMLDIPDAFVAGRPGLDDYLRLLVGRGELGDGDPEDIVAGYRARATRQWSAERTRPDGRIIEVRNNPVPDGGAVLIYSDITERKRAEAQIAAARDAAEEALEQQTATAEILRAISQSPTDIQPVLDAVVKAAVRFCGATDALIILREGEDAVFVAHEGPIVVVLGSSLPLNRQSAGGRALLDGRTCHFPDIASLDPVEFAAAHQFSRAHGFRAILAAPLLRQSTTIGAVVLRKAEVGPFTPRQIELLETFAAQAVIAIENVRLFTELREALEQQTATADILSVISRSPTDVQPVLEAVTRAALRFCGAPDAIVLLRDGDESVVVAHEGTLTATLGLRRPLAGNFSGQAMLEGCTRQIADVDALDVPAHAGILALARQHKWRASAAAPMMHGGKAIGCVVLRKPEPGLLSPRQIALLETFAAQAVIAIENVRLFTELREALDQQTATAEILRVISQSPTDVNPVLAAVVKAALKFCGARDALISLRDGDTWFIAAHEGPIEATRGPRPLTRGTAPGRAMVDGVVAHVADLQSPEAGDYPEAREYGAREGFRAVLAAPLLRDNVPIGAISLRRPEPGAFTPSQVDLLRSFAAQAVIAIENVRLFTELRDSLERLKAAQANLIQSEKMASLGQLTAGIAHEIKNPLNFVNNFATLSVELLGELKETADAAFAALDADTQAEVDETMELLTANLGKIAEHGKRADGIVRSMLSHSRGGSGDWTPSDLNALVEEALNLAYHGARAQDNEFNVTLERDLAKDVRSIELVPQDVTRVFLNLFGNSFYAVGKRRRADTQAGFRPTLRVSTRDLGEAVEVKVRDNGTGIPPEVREKLFQPFFTTKPTGEGTGLGLSISYDVVTQQHGGTIEVESEPGSFTEFTVRLPRRRVEAREGAR